MDELEFWDSIESGFYFMIVGYYMLLFAYFLLMRYRTSKKQYWLYFSLFFLCLALGRVFFIGYYFFLPKYGIPNAELVSILMIFYRIATFCTWMGIACLTSMLGILLLPPDMELDKKIPEKSEAKSKIEGFLSKKDVRVGLRVVLMVAPIFVGILALILPDVLFMDPNFITEYGIPDPGL
ncbi:unnamed protein product, partial [marine sediment metagenome]